MRIGRYELLTELGAGGMATLHLARRTGPDQFQKLVVIKRMHEELSRDAEASGRFLDEARLAARIVHPNVVQIFDFDRDQGSAYIAMEYVHGLDLMALFDRACQAPGGSYHWSHAARIVAEAAAGLHAAHELKGDQGQHLNLVHRDVSLQNVLVSFDGYVKVTDFGIAHAVGRAYRTMLGVVIGKVAYMSPEQCRGTPLDRRSDVFALGVVLHELVSMKRLFKAATDQQTMERVIFGQIPPLCSPTPGVPAALERIASKALARDPGERFQSAAELQQALEELLVRERLLVNAASLQTLMLSLFPAEKASRDALVTELYRRALPEQGAGVGSSPEPMAATSGAFAPTLGPGSWPSGAGAGPQVAGLAVSGAGAAPSPAQGGQLPAGDPVLGLSTLTGKGEAVASTLTGPQDPWGEAVAATVQDVAPPAVQQPSAARRTRMGFDRPTEGSAPAAQEDLKDRGREIVPREHFPRDPTSVGRPQMPGSEVQAHSAHSSQSGAHAAVYAPGAVRAQSGVQPAVDEGRPARAKSGAHAPAAMPHEVGGAQGGPAPAQISKESQDAAGWGAARGAARSAAQGAARSAAQGEALGAVYPPAGPAPRPVAGFAAKLKTAALRYQWYIFGGLLLVLLALLALVWLSGIGREKQPAKGAAKRSASEPGADMSPMQPSPARTQAGEVRITPLAEGRDALVRIRVRLAPSSARLFVEGREWTEKTPGDVRILRLGRKTSPILLRATAPGHLPKELQLVPNADMEVELELTARVRPGPRQSPSQSGEGRRDVTTSREGTIRPFGDEGDRSPMERPRPAQGRRPGDLKDPF